MAAQDPDTRPPSMGSRLTVRFDEGEDAQLRKLAHATGVGVSTLVRAMTLDALGQGRVPDRIEAAVEPAHTASVGANELRLLRTELNRIGVNLNQIARDVNTYGTSSVGSVDAVFTLQELLTSVCGVEQVLGGVKRA